jgi:hypothetical protein
MLLLTSTSDIVRIVTVSATTIDVHASWVDVTTGPTFTVGRTNTAITTATTTTVVASPAASTQRNIKHLNIENKSSTTSSVVTIQHFDGTTSIDLYSVTLLPGENVIFTSEGDWHHHDSNGADYAYSGPLSDNLGITGTLAETHPRQLLLEVNSTVPTASGTLWMQSIYLKAGQTINNIILSSAATAANTPTNYIAGIFDINRNLVAQTANQTTTAWAANTVKTIALTAAKFRF